MDRDVELGRTPETLQDDRLREMRPDYGRAEASSALKRGVECIDWQTIDDRTSHLTVNRQDPPQTSC